MTTDQQILNILAFLGANIIRPKTDPNSNYYLTIIISIMG